MTGFIIRRLLSMIPVLIIVSIISFALLYVLPGDPAVALLGDQAGDPATYQALREQLGLNDPIYVQYFKWVDRLFHGDMGTSIRTHEAVTHVLFSRAPISLYIGFAGLLVGILVGIPAAVFSALRPGSKIDSISTVVGLAGIALPSFWFALLLIYAFGVKLRWLPPSGYTPFREDPWLSLKMVIMPALVLGLTSAAIIMRQSRSALIEVLQQDYITTAYAKGFTERRVVVAHAARNAMIPLLTILGLQIGNLVSGSAIVETVFAIPGVGRAAVDAIFFRDYPVLQGAILMLTIAVLIANLLTDVAYGIADPRIRVR